MDSQDTPNVSSLTGVRAMGEILPPEAAFIPGASLRIDGGFAA